jgi:hypothetical protein
VEHSGLSNPCMIYYIYRGYGIMIEMSNSRLRHVVKYLAWKNIPAVRSLRDPRLLMWGIKGLREGLKIGTLKRAKEGEIDIYKAPLIKLGPIKKVLEILLPHKIFEGVAEEF